MLCASKWFSQSKRKEVARTKLPSTRITKNKNRSLAAICNNFEDSSGLCECVSKTYKIKQIHTYKGYLITSSNTCIQCVGLILLPQNLA